MRLVSGLAHGCPPQQQVELRNWFVRLDGALFNAVDGTDWRPQYPISPRAVMRFKIRNLFADLRSCLPGFTGPLHPWLTWRLPHTLTPSKTATLYEKHLVSSI